MKGELVNTWLGHAGMNFRDSIALHLAAARKLESLPCAANDKLARQLLERLCDKGATFIDVGAHIGSVIAGVGRHSQPGKIIAIEAIPEKAALLRRRFAKGGRTRGGSE